MAGLDDTLGATVVGFVVSTFLLGVLSLQVFHYYRNFPDDRRSMKILVGTVWLLDLGHTICGWMGIYTMVVTFYGQPEHLIHLPVPIRYLSVFSALPIFLAQVFFSTRIGRLSGYWRIARLLMVFCAIPTILTFALLIVVERRGGNIIDLQAGPGHVLMLITTAWLPFSHVALAAALCWYLWPSHKVESGFTLRTRTVIGKIIVWTIETTLIACVVAILYVITYLTRKDLVWMAFYAVHPKIISNTMMASYVVGIVGRNFRPTSTYSLNSRVAGKGEPCSRTIQIGTSHVVIDVEQGGSTDNALDFTPGGIGSTTEAEDGKF
ncbi:hypothetical protein C8F01DRAFT_1254528 [Mycena amicta]|nr:hypothetical protein C8F01DRAFT_1254528 [Mycena amicta]